MPYLILVRHANSPDTPQGPHSALKGPNSAARAGAAAAGPDATPGAHGRQTAPEGDAGQSGPPESAWFPGPGTPDHARA